MRSAVSVLALAALCLPALAGEPYTPVKLKPAEVVTPPAELVTMATQFLEAVRQGNGDAIGAAIADEVTAVDGALDLHVKRRKEVLGPFKTTEEKLVALASYIGGDYERPEGVDSTPFAIKAEREYIVEALTDGRPWGTDPMFKGSVCSYAYRSFDQAATKKLADKQGTQSSSLFYVDAATPVLAAADPKAVVAATLEPDLLYVLDYDTDAPKRWMAVHLPDGGTAFVSFDKVDLQKPYASGICFAKTKAGWQMVGQASTSL